MTRTIVLLLSFLLTSALLAQETRTDGSEPDETARPSDPRATLNEQTLGRDIDTAGFYELVAWLEGLGLDTSGDRQTLARRLREHFAIPIQAVPGESERPLVVDSAAQTRYFSLSDIDERYVRLSGGVTITLRDEERDVSHRIVADEVTFNQDLNVLSASGNVIYTLDRGGTIEQFSGEALSVQLDNWEGGFVEGVTRRARTIEGEEVDFSFAGSYITRSADDVVVMENGRVTSSVATPPNYEIRADKIWVLAPGEWGLRNAYLYVGRVRVFYFPFFFRPGNKLFFNPSVGSRSREGRFVQTTTYLIGQPQEDDTAFSFLQIAEEEDTASNTVREGLYLVPDESTAGEEPAEGELKLLADVYTKLGAYAAIEGSFPQVGSLTDVALFGGLGVSRNLYRYSYPGQGTTFSPYYISGGEPVVVWNSSSIGAVNLPFRFGLGLAASLRGETGSITGELDYYSDSLFSSDFGKRSEQIDWLGLVGQGSPTTGASPVSSFEWALRGSVNPKIDPSLQWVQRIQLQNATVVLRWREKTLASPDTATSAADDSPDLTFFYPDTFESPNVSAVLSGQLLGLSSGSDARESDAEIPDNPLRPPWDEASPKPAEPDQPFRLPGLQPAFPSPPVPEVWNMSLGYTLTPSGLVQSTFDKAAWSEPSDVDFSIAYTTASGRMVASLPLTLNLLSGAVGFTGSLGATGQYRTLFNRGDNVDDQTWDSLEAQAYSYSSVNATSNLTTRVSPFARSVYWSGSNVAHTLNLLLYQLVYDEDNGTGDPPYLATLPGWDDTTVRTHQLLVTAALALFGGQQLKLTADLPPRTPRFTGQLDLQYLPVTASVSSGVAEEGDSWIFQPITSTQTIAFGQFGRLQNQLSYDPEASELSYNTTTTKLGPVTGSFEFRTGEGFTFGGSNVGWVSDGDRAFRANRASVGADISGDLEPLWGNRLLLSGSASSSWSMNLLRYTESDFGFGLNGTLEIPDFLTVNVSSQSNNNQSYVYIGPLAEGVGRERRSFFLDLLQSFNFFSRAQRVDSAFNLQQVKLDAVHNLEDWDLIVSYAGRPEVVEFFKYLKPDPSDPSVPDDPEEVVSSDFPGAIKRTDRREYEWQSTLSIELRWRAIRELASNARANNQRREADLDEGSGWDITFGDDS